MEEFGSFDPGNDQLNEAIERYEKMLSQASIQYFDVDEFEHIIDYYMIRNKNLKAKTVIETALNQHPNSIIIQIKQAQLLVEQGLFPQALKLLKKLEKIETEDASVFFLLGTIYNLTDKIEEADNYYTKSVDLEEEDKVDLLLSIASGFQQTGNFDTAIKYLKIAIEIDPDDEHIVYELIISYQLSGDLEKALQKNLEYVDRWPLSETGWFNLGNIYQRLEKTDEAIEAYDFTNAINPKNASSLFNKGQTLIEAENFKEAISCFNEFLELNPDNEDAIVCLGECHEKLEHIQSALQYYEKALKTKATCTDAWAGLGRIKAKEGKFDEAIAYYKKAIDNDPGDPYYLLSIGEVYEKNKNRKLAIENYTQALSEDPFDEETWIHTAGLIQEEQGDKQGMDFLLKAYKHIGDSPQLNIALAEKADQLNDEVRALQFLETALKNYQYGWEEFKSEFPDIIGNEHLISYIRNYFNI